MAALGKRPPELELWLRDRAVVRGRRSQEAICPATGGCKLGLHNRHGADGSQDATGTANGGCTPGSTAAPATPAGFRSSSHE